METQSLRREPPKTQGDFELASWPTKDVPVHQLLFSFIQNPHLQGSENIRLRAPNSTSAIQPFKRVH